MVNQQGTIIFSNRTANAMLGYKTGALHDKPVEVLIPEALHRTHQRLREDYYQQPVARIMSEKRRLLAVKQDGSKIPVCISLKPATLADQQLVVVGIDDISELEAIEQNKAQAQKLEALGEMVSGIAHNFNNILAGISGQSYLLQSQFHLEPMASQKVQSIDTLCEKASTMIRQLMLYARNGDADANAERHKTNIIPAIRQAVDLCRLGLPARIELIEQFRLEYAQLLCEPGQVQQVIINLINNALQAIGDNAGGRIAVKVMECPTCGCGHPKCPVNLSCNTRQAGPLLCVKVKDNGCGIPDAALDRIFDPFFSTKPSGEGTGLGLSTAFGTIGQLHGHITARNRNKQGAEVQFFLPIISDEHDLPQLTRVEKTTPADRPATILLMEDDDDMLQLLGDIVEGFGYRTIAVSDGDEGVAAFNACCNRIDLVITDIAMPMMDGLTAMRGIRKIRPDIPCIFLTGFSETMHELGEQDIVMMKPFDIIKLSKEIDRLVSVRKQPACTS